MADKKKIEVLIPSRSQPRQLHFLATAIQSLAEQMREFAADLSVTIAVDPGQELDLDRLRPVAGAIPLRTVRAERASQAAALNAAIGTIDADFAAFLEDDDQWRGAYLETAFGAFSRGADFVSTTQIEVDEQGVIVKINDYPAPSGWIMRRGVLDAVGTFDEQYRFHLDNDWLGRLALTEFARCHLIEATAPVSVDWLAAVRPHLFNCLRFGGRKVSMLRHQDPLPLVRRLVHDSSGTGMIRTQENAKARSDEERRRLCERYGYQPW
jgi:hypothetical protein